MRGKAAIGLAAGAVVVASVSAAAGAILTTTHSHQLGAGSRPSSGATVMRKGVVTPTVRERIVGHVNVVASTTLIGHGEVTLSPPGAGTTSPISADSAFAIYLANAPMAPSGTPTTVELADMTSTDGPIPMVDRLVWVVEYANSPIIGYGGPSPTGVKPQTTSPGMWIGVVDAISGSYLETENWGT